MVLHAEMLPAALVTTLGHYHLKFSLEAQQLLKIAAGENIDVGRQYVYSILQQEVRVDSERRKIYIYPASMWPTRVSLHTVFFPGLY
jgi:adenosine deaminase